MSPLVELPLDFPDRTVLFAILDLLAAFSELVEDWGEAGEGLSGLFGVAAAEEHHQDVD